jgi:curved DNA-binding protein CbpA
LSAELPNLYATLGLDRRCTLAQIRAAYRLLAKQHHPDRNPEAPESLARTQELNAAYETLSDTSRRRVYDRDLDASKETSSTRGTRKIERNISQDVHLPSSFFAAPPWKSRQDRPINGTETTGWACLRRRHRARAFVCHAAGHQKVALWRSRKVLPGFRFKARGSDLGVPPATAPGARFRWPRDDTGSGGHTGPRADTGSCFSRRSAPPSRRGLTEAAWRPRRPARPHYLPSRGARLAMSLGDL